MRQELLTPIGTRFSLTQVPPLSGKGMRRGILPTSLLLLALISFLSDSTGARPAAWSQKEDFKTTVAPFITRHCTPCHDSKLKTAGLNLEAHREAGAAVEARDVWHKVLDKLRTAQMPPPGRVPPSSEELKSVIQWIEEFVGVSGSDPPDPGRVTARRLNRVEYNNTIRDLLALDFRPADDFPVDDEGYGFDNIGDVLSLSPVLMEKYLAAAEKIARSVIVVGPSIQPTVERYNAEKLKQFVGIQTKHRFPADAEYDLRAGLGGIRPDGSPVVKLGLSVDGVKIKLFDVDPLRNKPRTFEVRLPVKAGDHEVGLSFVDDNFKPEENPIASRDRYLAIDYVEIRGPFNPVKPSLTESHRRVVSCGHANGDHRSECIRVIATHLARRAFRRPATESEIDGLVRLTALAEREGDSFEEGVRVALQAVLVSPQFLFRIERDPKPDDPDEIHPVSEHELVSRLSYFLWSSMPDDELFRCADDRTLRKPGVLEAQVLRMLADPKSRALVENFAGQWLQLRNLDFVKPDPDRFPEFDEELRDAMRRETQLFFETIVREDRPILDFIDGKFTFLNQRLARHYGIAGVEGDWFRRVRLKGAQRSGLLTQGSILTVSSYATRTSPVLRGKWILENFLNAPPPPPPPGVANLNEAALGSSGTLRQQLEKHRSDPSCSVCHARMDALGFGLENYNAVGAWRTRDGKSPVDSAGTLPGGKTFRGSSGLKDILKNDREAFAQCLTEKMLTYALGRGLERFDRPAVNSIARRLASADYRFSRLVLEIVNSLPFQMRRGDGGKPS
jgi:Protein of unknown function (DUF1592)/Protein of unknown function (DUF1588)/Protein of unknown function (DUF1587)/Protein of unknown function (DUF1585)/Protein of unknown function (DUF1595)/Ca-dependent carbohydrate-binding module xylan-binding/Planctomycete cytochrome C